MILALDIGNSQIYGGVFDQDHIRLRFRKNSKDGFSSDEVGLFLRSVIRENGIDPSLIQHIAICSVVPDVVHSIRNACKKYFGLTPFNLRAGVKTGLKINYRNPLEMGADRIANSIAAVHKYPGKNLIIVDLGTATTFCAITSDKQHQGGVILAGLRISMEALEGKTAKLPSVEILAPTTALGRGTVESIQSGLYYGHLGAMKEILTKLREEVFQDQPVFVIGTGGFSSLFERERIFDAIQPDLILQGLNVALKLNTYHEVEAV